MDRGFVSSFFLYLKSKLCFCCFCQNSLVGRYAQLPVAQKTELDQMKVKHVYLKVPIRAFITKDLNSLAIN